jgi:hypothetical protein
MTIGCEIETVSGALARGCLTRIERRSIDDGAELAKDVGMPRSQILLDTLIGDQAINQVPMGMT